jgi:hypothetical protein
MFMCSAADLLSTSAFGFSTLSDIFFRLGEPKRLLSRESERERCGFAFTKVTELRLETEEKKKQRVGGFRAFRNFDILMFISSEIPPELDWGRVGSCLGLSMPG